jgi:GWxTD domain-containing protein
MYNTKKMLGDSSKFVINYYIESYETRKQLPKFSRVATQRTNQVNVLLMEFNIADLPSGNYNVVAEVRDRNNSLVADRRVFFQRYNPKAKFDVDDLSGVSVANTFVSKMTDRDSLVDHIRSLRPISSEAEKLFADNQLKTASLELMQQFMFSFWYARDNANPQMAWQKYYLEVLKVNKSFGSAAFKGYDTDRGRVYLQYGPPDQRTVVDNEPNSYPYEIWQYYRIRQQNQTNKKFVFWNEDLAGSDYKLLHSDARGEIYNTSWQMKLQKRTIQSNNMDIEKPGIGDFGNHQDENFNNPK